ncbi:MAG TPA: amidohydrolase family protein [Vicinamibacteria bacterium]|nr:amidohydrolase family protein [Vicinamibacteria bacterium]
MTGGPRRDRPVRGGRSTLANATLRRGGALDPGTLFLAGGVVVAGGGSAGPEADLDGRIVVPGLVNAHDHLDLATMPPLGRPPYPNVYAWTADVEGHPEDSVAAADALSVPLTDRLFLGGLRNLLAGVTAVAHHGPYHRALARPDFPVRVLARYHFAHSPGLTPELRRTYRTTDRRIPWMVHAGEGTDERSRGELLLLEQAHVLRQNTVVVHGIALGEEDGRRMAAARACLAWCPESNRLLYSATARIGILRTAGVRVGLGSDSPLSGARDALSNLAAARAEGVVADSELLDLATTESAEVARLPVGGTREGDPADLVVVDSLEALLAGDRRSVALVVTAGRARYGHPDLLAALGVRSAPLVVDGAPRAMEVDLARRAGSLLRRHPAVGRTRWAQGVELG